jgi:hypothetical protein
MIFRKNFNYCLSMHPPILGHANFLRETIMTPSQFGACESTQDVEVEAQLCAYNSAFDELGLRFRWDANTLALLAMIEGEEARIAAYIEAHHPHLLKAYSPGFLSRAILEKKNARYPVSLPKRAGSAVVQVQVVRERRIGSRRERASYEIDLPALAGV